VLPATKVAFLTRLALKGESIGEIAAFARALRAKAVPLPLDAATRAREILDVVGTGGDRLGTFNISTCAAIICAAAGVTVAKHGNRAATSRCGSADVLEALGVRIDATPEAAARALRELGFAFFFAPNYHPAFKHVAAARKLCAERGQRTIFNFLGPLLNPASPSAMLVGVPRPELCEPLAHVLQSLGIRRAMVVCGSVPSPSCSASASALSSTPAINPNYLDELSTLGPNQIAEFYQERGFNASLLSPDQFPLHTASLADLLGADCQTNAQIVRRLLAGEERGPKRDAVLLNAAAALFVAGQAKSLAGGWDLASDTIDTGRAHAKLAALATT
jgi:anthranilate phosphoribosyltransferase